MRTGESLSRHRCQQISGYFGSAAPEAACSMRDATASGRDRNTAWLALISTTFEPARFAIKRSASGGTMWSSVVTRYQLGFVFHAASVTTPFKAATPQGT